ncbi:MAG: SIMPL domain-containing protein [Tepidisphaeraceae bacterium]
MNRSIQTLAVILLTCVVLSAGTRHVLAQAPEPALWRHPVPSLTVSGDAEVSVAPDRATVRLGAVGQAPTAAEAQNKVNEVVARAIDAIKDAGIDEKDIQTSGLSLQPVYTQPQRGEAMAPDFQPRIVAYRASNTVQVTVNDVAKVGDAIDAGVKSGANQLEGISFDLKDDAAQRREALAQAVQEARAKAEALATAAGVKLGAFLDISESGVQVFPHQMPMMAMRAEMGHAATPVQPGQVRVHASVTLRYRIDAAGPAPGAERAHDLNR